MFKNRKKRQLTRMIHQRSEVLSLSLLDSDSFYQNLLEEALTNVEEKMSYHSERLVCDMEHVTVQSQTDSFLIEGLVVLESKRTTFCLSFPIHIETRKLPYVMITHAKNILTVKYSGHHSSQNDLRKLSMFSQQTDEHLLQIDNGLKKYYTLKRFKKNMKTNWNAFSSYLTNRKKKTRKD